MTDYGSVRLSDLLEPVLNAVEESDAELDHAVGLVAEALAALGVLVVGRNGRPLSGASDEKAVLAALSTYARLLADSGRLDDALDVSHLMRRVARLDRSNRYSGRSQI